MSFSVYLLKLLSPSIPPVNQIAVIVIIVEIINSVTYFLLSRVHWVKTGSKEFRKKIFVLIVTFLKPVNPNERIQKIRSILSFTVTLQIKFVNLINNDFFDSPPPELKPWL